jgi:hypothetical protein
VSSNQTYVQCDQCNQWWHHSCTGIADSHLYTYTDEDKYQEYNCLFCQLNCLETTPTLKYDLIGRITGHAITTSSVITTICEVVQVCASDSPAVSEHTSEAVQVGTQLDNDNTVIVILDNIDKSSQFQDSKDIIRDVKRNKPTLNVYHTYPLTGCVICLHLHSEEDANLALGSWPSGSFQSESHCPHLPACRTANIIVVARNVDTSVTEQSLADELTKTYNQTVKVKRFRNRNSGKPTPVISVQ